jgi:hypothetical protein
MMVPGIIALTFVRTDFCFLRKFLGFTKNANHHSLDHSISFPLLIKFD